MKKIYALIIVSVLLISAALPALASGVSLVNNGGFEETSQDGMPSFWSFHSYEAEYNGRIDNASASCETDPERGSVLRVSAKTDDDAAVFQSVKVEPLSIYRLSCFIRTEGVDGGAGANIALRDIIAVSDGLFGDNGWTEVELVGRTGPTQNTLTVSCRIGGYSAVAHGTAWFDDFKVEKFDKADGEVVPFYAAAEDTTGNGGSGGSGT